MGSEPWWAAPEWGKAHAMSFGKPPGPEAKFRRVAVTTEPHLKDGKLVLKNCHPHVAVRIYTSR